MVQTGCIAAESVLCEVPSAQSDCGGEKEYERLTRKKGHRAIGQRDEDIDLSICRR